MERFRFPFPTIEWRRSTILYFLWRFNRTMQCAKFGRWNYCHKNTSKFLTWLFSWLCKHRSFSNWYNTHPRDSKGVTECKAWKKVRIFEDQDFNAFSWRLSRHLCRGKYLVFIIFFITFIFLFIFFSAIW